ncbi:VWA domain-containing protein [Candidatus Dependentiae bacterium]|nr:VWA domain-containing protein [Candidatus Dependentiae bacterium]
MVTFSDISFAGLKYLWLVSACALVFVGVVAWRVRNVVRSISILRSGAMTSLFKCASMIRIVGKALLSIVGFLMIMMALMRPQSPKQEETMQQEGRDLLIAVDVSRSMLAQDVEPNRLSLTKQKIHTLVERLGSDRVGLVLFSGTAFLQCPLTSDRAAFFMFLDAVDVETISSGSTALDEAMRKSLEVFQQVPSRQNKILVIFTDGEDFSTNLADIQQAVQQEKMNIFTMGVGTAQGAPIPVFDEKGKQIGHQKDKKGSVVISRLDETMLQNIAQETSGVYVRVIPENDRDIDVLVNKVAGYEKERFEDKKIARMQEQYHWFLFISFVCLALEWIW